MNTTKSTNMRRHAYTLCLLLFAATVAEIVDPHNNIPSEQKFGVARDEAHPGCKGREHAKSLDVLSEGDYDFIVVGGGSAGNVVASRLVDTNPNIKVLILESGKNLVDSAEVQNESLKKLLKVEYCVPGQTAEKCPIASLPLHFTETPFMALYPSASNHSFYYQTVPQVYGNKREINYPRGKLLGGSSSTNNLIAFRGWPEDYDEWASMGLSGWSYNDLLPFLKRVESNHDYPNSTAHGTDGPIHLKKSSFFHDFPVINPLIDTAVEKLGYPRVEDFNKGYDHYGAGEWQQYTNEKGRRTSSYEYVRRLIKQNKVCIDGYIAEAETGENADLKVPSNPNNKNVDSRQKCTDKQNLHILSETHATKVNFETKNGKPRAVSVEYVDASVHPYRAVRPFPAGSPKDEEEKSRQTMNYWKPAERHEVMNCPVPPELALNNERASEWYIPPENRDYTKDLKKVTAKREIILASGAINTPQTLMLSGVGPKEHLKNQLGFTDEEIYSDLPGLGNRVLDHEEMTINFELPHSKQHWGPVKDFLSHADAWTKGEKSALASNHAPGGMDISSDGPTGKKATVHVHFLMLYMENLDINHWLKQDITKRLPVGLTDFAFYKGLQHWTALLERSGACSKGSIRLKNRDPFLPPLLDMNYGSCNFSNHELLFALKEVRKLNSLLPEEFRGTEVNPGPEFDTDEKILNFIRTTVWGHHISGSAPMGKCDDVNAVLDNHGRVYGVEGLRVADASVFPTVPHGNILYSTYGVAERISDFILKDNGLKTTGPSALNPTTGPK